MNSTRNTIVCLDPRQKLVDVVADWLTNRARQDNAGVRTARIYDFKTNGLRGGEAADAFERRIGDHYAGQMAAYRKALSRLCRIDESNVSTTLLLTATGTSVEV